MSTLKSIVWGALLMLGSILLTVEFDLTLRGTWGIFLLAALVGMGDDR